MGIISIIFSVVWQIVIAAALTFLVAGVKFFKDTKTIGKRWFLLGVWGKAIINCIVAVFDVALLMISESDFESIIKYTKYFISNFIPIASWLAVIGIILIIKAIIVNKVINKRGSKALAEGEEIAFSQKSAFADKVESVCKKVVLFGGLGSLLFVTYMYNPIGSIFNFIENLDDSYGDIFREIYYLASDIPAIIATTCALISFILLVTTLVCLFTKNTLKITNKGVYGTGNFCKKIDLSFDNITGIEKKKDNGLIIKKGLSQIRLVSIDDRDTAYDLIKPNVKEIEPRIITKGEKTMVTINPLLKQAWYKLSTLAILNVVTFGIWQYVWIYKMTNALNLVDEKEQRDATKTLLLCLFIPMYAIWWFYKSAAAIKKLEDALEIKSDIGVLVPVFAVFCPLIAMLMVQDNLNKIVE